MTITEINAELRQLVRDFTTATSAAANYVDPALSGTGLMAKRERLVHAARTTGQNRLDTVKSRFDSEVSRLAGGAQRALPAGPASTADAWGKVKMLLDAKQPLQYVVEKATPEQLHALTEWGPVYLDATTPVVVGIGAGQTRLVPIEALERSIWERWAEVLPETGAAAVTEFLGAAPEIGGFQSYVTFAENRIAGLSTVSDMEASIAAQMARQAAAQNLALAATAAAAVEFGA